MTQKSLTTEKQGISKIISPISVIGINTTTEMGDMITTEQYLEQLKSKRKDEAKVYDYSKVVYTGSQKKITLGCPIHGEFEQYAQDHKNGSGCWKCGKIQAKQTNIERYGVDNPFKKVDLVQRGMVAKYGVPNPGLMADHIEKMKATNLEKYGAEWSSQTEEVNQRRNATNLEKYGSSSPMKNKAVSRKMIETKIRNGGFTNSNASNEATQFIRNYIAQKGYDISQCAYADSEAGVFEWGWNQDSKWMLFDLVVFEEGHRGSKDHIIEILEYHGPFHYTKEDVAVRGNEPAYPWKSKTTTIAESFDIDMKKESFAKTLTDNFTVVWGKPSHSRQCR